MNKQATLAALSALFLVACGGGGGSGTPAPAPAPDPAAPASAAAPAPVAPMPLTGGRTAVSSCGVTPSPAAGVVYGDVRAASLGAGASLNGTQPFPADNAWNQDISTCPVDPDSDNLIAKIGAGTGLHPDFGAGFGIPYVVVSGTQSKVAVNFANTAESDPGPYPVPPNAPVESGGDGHVLVIDKDHQRLYEMFASTLNSNGSWSAGSGAIFNLDSNSVRPTAQPRWTSADAAGLPIFPGLARYDEAVKGPGGIRHALRFTVNSSRAAYVPPASHWAPRLPATFSAPMGMRVRLKASYVIPSGFSSETKALLTAMKTYGMIVADNGTNWFVSGAPDNRWNSSLLRDELLLVKGSNFEVVRMDGLVVGP